MQVTSPAAPRGTFLHIAPRGSQAFGNLKRRAGAHPERTRLFRPSAFLVQAGLGRKIVELERKQTIFSQGDPAEAVFYIQRGKVRLSVISPGGKEATIALLGAGDFLGEESMADSQVARIATAAAITPATVLRIERTEMVRALHEQNALSDIFISHLLDRNARVMEDLADQLFNFSEKRLARALLLLARSGEGEDGKPETVIPKISQATLAEMVGTTRSRVSHFMNRFRRSGYIDYNARHNGVLRVRGALLNVVLHKKAIAA